MAERSETIRSVGGIRITSVFRTFAMTFSEFHMEYIPRLSDDMLSVLRRNT